MTTCHHLCKLIRKMAVMRVNECYRRSSLFFQVPSVAWIFINIAAVLFTVYLIFSFITCNVTNSLSSGKIYSWPWGRQYSKIVINKNLCSITHYQHHYGFDWAPATKLRQVSLWGYVWRVCHRMWHDEPGSFIFMDPCIVDDSVEIPTRCSFVIEFIVPKFIEGSACFERHTAHRQEL